MRATIVNTVFALALALALDGCAVLESKAAVIGCQAADTVTTLHALDLGAREANPIVDWLLKEFGPSGFIVAKVAVTLLFLQVYPDVSSDLVILLNSVTCAVAARNAVIAGKLERGAPAD